MSVLTDFFQKKQHNTHSFNYHTYSHIFNAKKLF